MSLLSSSCSQIAAMADMELKQHMSAMPLSSQPLLQPSSLAILPDDILPEILARVGLLTLQTCALVCTKWHSILRSANFARLYSSLHTQRTWFTLFTTPLSRNLMLVYESITERPLSRKCLHSADESSAALAMESGDFGQRGEELLATADGLVLSMSAHGSFTITNIVTRKKKLLPSPSQPPFLDLAFVGMAYTWATMSYRVLLCGQLEASELNEQPEDGGLVTILYNSLTGLWTDSGSTLSSETFIPETDPWFRESGADQFARPRTCIWLDGRFYCVLNRAVLFFDVAAMEWGKLHSQLPRKGVMHHCTDKMQVFLPPNLVHFFCLWERDGELLISGSVKSKDPKFITEIWRLMPPLQSAAKIAHDDGSVLFAWEPLGHIPSHVHEGDDLLRMPGMFEGKQRYARGNVICVSIVDDADFEDYKKVGPAKGPFGECQVQFYIYDLVKKSFKLAERIPITTIFMDLICPANLAIQPCPFTSP